MPAAAPTGSTGTSIRSRSSSSRPTTGWPRSRTTFQHAYDPRVTWIEDRWYVDAGATATTGRRSGSATRYDFRTFHQLDNAFLPFNRNGVLFPRRIGDRYAMLSRPSDNGHTPFGDIFYSESPDLVHWGRHRHVMAPQPWTWQSTKIGAGPTPIETPEGWLLIYHGVLTSCNGFVYSMGAALLDLDEPWKVIARGRDYLLSPQVAVRAGRATSPTSSSRAPRSSTRRRTGSRSTTARPTRSRAWRTATCPRSSPRSAARPAARRDVRPDGLAGRRGERLDRADRAALDEPWPDQRLDDRGLRELEPMQQQRHREPAHPELVDGHRRELRRDEAREVDVVVADDRQGARHVDARPLRPLDEGDGDRVVGSRTRPSPRDARATYCEGRRGGGLGRDVRRRRRSCGVSSASAIACS